MHAALLAAVLGIVIPDTPITPWCDVVGRWAGASATAIAPNWVITARHNSHNHENYHFKMDGVNYDVIGVYPHEFADFMLLKINPATPLPRWACIGDSVPNGPENAFYAQAGGYGRQAGAFINGLSYSGYCWGSKEKAWGENEVYRVNTFLCTVFDEDSPYSGECAAAEGDSGGPVVVLQNGRPAVIGIWVGATINCPPCGPSGCDNGASWYTLQSYALAISEPEFKRWIMRYLQPGDANLDGVTNYADLMQVICQLNNTGPNLSGDVNLDGIVNFADQNIILSNFNTALDCIP